MFNDNINTMLNDDGLRLSEGQLGQLAAFCALVRSANEAASLVSIGDSAKLETVHVPDSLSLAPWVIRKCKADGHLLDIGSGGGFPAIPIKVVVPSLKMTLLERSVKKSAFLRTVVEEMGLSGVEVVTGEFPFAAKGLKPDLITARAVERPEKLRRQVLQYMDRGCTFFCQMPQSLGVFPPTFHVEHIADNWTQATVRRGTLDIVRLA